MTSTTSDHYATLGVNPDATADDIEAAWLRLRGVHPDKHKSDPRADRHFARVSAAYRELINPTTRAAYDAQRAATQRPDNVTIVDLVGEIARDAKGLDAGRIGVRLLDNAASPEGRGRLRAVWQGLVDLMR